MASERKALQGTLQIIRYNWSFYLVGALGILVAVTLLELVHWPRLLEALGIVGVCLGVWWLLASIVASWWVYDLSPLMSWQWLADLVPAGELRWANLHAGLDESTPQLTKLWGPPVEVLDFFDSVEMTEKSIHRARALVEEPKAKNTSYSSLPLETGGLDLACVIFSAHELRSPAAREAFFGELKRGLAPSGKLLVVEHVRDLANLGAFGPGFMHFMPDSEWKRLADREGLRPLKLGRLTPFIHFYLWEKP